MNVFPSIHITGAIHHWVRSRETGENSAPWYLGTAEISPRMRIEQYYADNRTVESGTTLPFQKQYEGQSATISVLLTRWSKFTESVLSWLGGDADTVIATGFAPFQEPAAPQVARFAGVDTSPQAGTVIVGGDEVIPERAVLNRGGDPKPTKPQSRGGLTGLIDSFKKEVGYTPPQVPTGFIAGTETRWSRGSLVFGSRDFELWQVFDFALHPTVRSQGLEIGWYWPQVTWDVREIVAAGTQGKKLLLTISAEPEYLVEEGSFVTSRNGGNDSFPAPGSPGGSERGWVLWTNFAGDFPAAVRVPQ